MKECINPSSNRLFEIVSVGLKVISNKAKKLVDKFDGYLILREPEAPVNEEISILKNIDTISFEKLDLKIAEKYR